MAIPKSDFEPTPGPYTVNVARLSDNSINVVHVLGPKGQGLAQISFYGEGETLANAALFAASRDMFAALKAVDRQTFCDCLQEDGSQIENSRTHHEPDCWVPILRAALAKARAA